MSRYTIVRANDLRFERAVKLKRDDEQKCLHIDPQWEILLATGVSASRQSCIISFADGLAASGHTVLINRWGQDTRVYCTGSTHIPLYWFLGLTWGLNQWTMIKTGLSYLVAANRFAILERTAWHYFHAPSQRPLHLQAF